MASVSSNTVDLSAEDLWSTDSVAVGSGDINKALRVDFPVGAYAAAISFVTNAGEVAFSATLGSAMTGHPQAADALVTWELPQQPGASGPELFLEVASATTVVISILGSRT